MFPWGLKVQSNRVDALVSSLRNSTSDNILTHKASHLNLYDFHRGVTLLPTNGRSENNWL